MPRESSGVMVAGSTRSPWAWRSNSTLACHLPDTQETVTSLILPSSLAIWPSRCEVLPQTRRGGRSGRLMVPLCLGRSGVKLMLSLTVKVLESRAGMNCGKPTLRPPGALFLRNSDTAAIRSSKAYSVTREGTPAAQPRLSFSWVNSLIRVNLSTCRYGWRDFWSSIRSRSAQRSSPHISPSMANAQFQAFCRARAKSSSCAASCELTCSRSRCALVTMALLIARLCRIRPTRQASAPSKRCARPPINRPLPPF